jgi:hypothetical protein
MAIVLRKIHLANDKRFKCPICDEYIRLNQLVCIDFKETLTHEKCGYYYDIHDRGYFRDIISKYPKLFRIKNQSSLNTK